MRNESRLSVREPENKGISPEDPDYKLMIGPSGVQFGL